LKNALPKLVFSAFLPFCAGGCSGFVCAQEAKTPEKIQTGLASYYHDKFEGRTTSSGEEFSQTKLVAAHPTFPPGTVVKVTNLVNKRSITVRIIDRGPADWAQKKGIIIDLSRAAASRLGFLKSGKVRVRLQVLKWGKPAVSATAAEPRL
jgi:rare lipoprotein A